jgi:hypothetical protein
MVLVTVIWPPGRLMACANLAAGTALSKGVLCHKPQRFP